MSSNVSSLSSCTSSHSSSSLRPSGSSSSESEYFDCRNEEGQLLGQKKLGKLVHQDGDWLAAVHIWVQNKQTGRVTTRKHILDCIVE